MQDRVTAAGDAGEFRTHWPALLAAFSGVALGIASMFLYSQGLFIKALQAEFGWSRTTISLSFLAGSLVCAVLSPLAGALVDRYRVRAVGCAGLVALAAYFALLGGFHGSLELFVLLNVVLAAFSAGSSPVTFSRLVTRHFLKRRGLALGIALSATGVTGALLPGLVGPVIAAHGWRAGYGLMAAMVLAAVPVVLVLGRSRPKTGAVVAGVGDDPAVGAGLAFAVRTRAFWVFLVAFTLATLAVGGFVVHFIPVLTDGGLTIGQAGGLAALIGLSVMAGRLSTGFAIDRLPAHLVAAVIFAVAALGCASLAIGPLSAAMISALCVGFALGAEMDVASYLVAWHFGTKHYGRIYGVIYGSLIVGITTSPALYAFLFDRTGSYHAALLGSAGLLLVSAAILATAPRKPAWTA